MPSEHCDKIFFLELCLDKCVVFSSFNVLADILLQCLHWASSDVNTSNVCRLSKWSVVEGVKEGDMWTQYKRGTWRLENTFGYQCLREVGWGARTGARIARGISIYAGPESMTVLEDSANVKTRGWGWRMLWQEKYASEYFISTGNHFSKCERNLLMIPATVFQQNIKQNSFQVKLMFF